MKKHFLHIPQISRLQRIPCILTLLLFCAAFLTGSAAGLLIGHLPRTKATSADVISDAASLLADSSSWGLSFQKEGERPIGNATMEELAPYDAYFAQDTTEQVIYLTFDAGYENGNTEPILDALKKHQVSATFFVVGSFLKQNPDLIRRMAEEGHTVGNHTMTHPDMSGIASMEAFTEELEGVSELYREITGSEMTKYYRPPQGIYSKENLAMAKELGYHTFFWSLAYVDWYQDDQPTKEEAFEKLLKRIHPGAIVLLHSTSSTNAEILDELLTRWEEMGYHFGTLNDFLET
jgi:peptidoglycan-N-acetylmuramic acid deacetylase